MERYDDRIETAMLPTDKTLKKRTSVPIQLVRFVSLNLRMVRMAFKAHN